MRAAVVRRDVDRVKHLVVEEQAAPVPQADEVLVRVGLVGICGSDLHGVLDVDSTAREDGLALGHEISGHVEALGEEVSSHDLALGDLVTIDPQVVCGRCVACREGWISICEHKRVLGSSLRGFEQGGLRELVAVPRTLVHRVPTGVGLEDAALVEPLANAWHVVARAGAGPGQSVVVLGAGPLGLCMIQCLRAAGVSAVVVSEPSQVKREVALAMGADAVVDPSDPGALRREVATRTDGVGADVVIESVGITATYREALEVVRKRGKVMFFGAVVPDVELPLLRILHRELELIGCTGANDETAAAIAALADGTVDLSAIPRATVGLADAEDGLARLADPGSGVVKLFVSPAG